MLFKTLLFALILYFILRATGRMVLAMRNSTGGATPADRRRGPSEPRATRDEPTYDIEDAKWEDL